MRTWKYSIILSLALHSLLFIHTREKVIKKQIKMIRLQIVDNESTGKKEKPLHTKFLSKENQKYERETIARKVGKPKLSMSQLGTNAVGKYIKPEPKGYTTDHVERVPLGDFTNLNTIQYKFFGFYKRMKGSIEKYWSKNLTKELKAFYSRGGSIEMCETGLLITMNSKGYVEHVEVNQSSGIHACDKAAVDAIENASPFLNPPKALVKNNKVHVQWNFIAK